jgi:hypothetical protein
MSTLCLHDLKTWGTGCLSKKRKATSMKNGRVYLEGKLNSNLYYAEVEPERAETALVAVDL